jgi:hypothetical protein
MEKEFESFDFNTISEELRAVTLVLVDETIPIATRKELYVKLWLPLEEKVYQFEEQRRETFVRTVQLLSGVLP